MADLANLLEALGLEAAHLLGAAAGGITAAGFAVDHPERTLSLILAGSIVAPDEPDWREVYDRLAIRDLEFVVPVEILELGPAFRARNPEGTAEFARLSKATTACSEPVAQPLGAHVTWSAFARMPVPTLLVTGEADLYAPPPLHELVAHYIPNHRVATLPAVGHAPYWEAPEAFNRIVLDFLAEEARLGRPPA